MKSIFIWGGVGVAVAAGIFLVLSFATPPAQDQQNGFGSQLSLPVSARDNIKGNRDSSLVLVEYGDFQCPACAAYVPLIKQLEQEFGSEIAVAYRHLPLRQIHPNAELSARAAQAAALQGKFWEMHDVLFEKQSSWAKISNPEDTFAEYAVSVGLDEQQFRNDLKSNEVRDRVQEDYASALADGLNSTPSFFFRGVRISNPQTYEQLRQLVLAALEQHGTSAEPAE